MKCLNISLIFILSITSHSLYAAFEKQLLEAVRDGSTRGVRLYLAFGADPYSKEQVILDRKKPSQNFRYSAVELAQKLKSKNYDRYKEIEELLHADDYRRNNK